MKAMSVFYVDGKHSRKSREKENAYLQLEGSLFGMPATTYVLKNNQEDTLSQYASAFCLVVTPATGPYGDMGDTYWEQIYASGELVKVDGREPTDDERIEWASLRERRGLAAAVSF